MHDDHNAFSLAPEVMCVKANMLTKYQRELYSTIYGRSASDSASSKLIANLYPKTKSYVIPFDANRLYGYAMPQPLPSGEYEWINPTNITLDFIQNYDFETCERVYILEVDLSYPRE